MTTKEELGQLFEYGEETNRIVAYARNADVALQDGFDAIGLAGFLLDPETKQPTGHQVIVQMMPQDAWALAQVILQIAKQRGWKFPEGVMVTGPGNPKKQN